MAPTTARFGLGAPVRAEAASALASFDGAVVEDGLAHALTDPDARVRATALGELNDTRSVQALTAATQDPSHMVRTAASNALNTMGVAAVVVGVATVMRESLRELGTGEGPAAGQPDELASPLEQHLPAAEAPPPQAPPTWQEALARLLKRTGGSPPR